MNLVKYVRNLGIARKITAFNVIVIVAVMSVLGVFNYHQQKKHLVQQIDNQLWGQTHDLFNMVELEVDANQVKINDHLALANYLTYLNGQFHETAKKVRFSAVNQITKEAKLVDVPEWKIGKYKVQHSEPLVDTLQHFGVQTATIFQKIKGGYLRIATNVRKLNGDRAIGTYIPDDSPVIKAVEQGKTFRGRAFVVNDWYLTCYEPIYINGAIKGILYVGTLEKDLARIEIALANISLIGEAYPFILSGNGEMLLHPKAKAADYSGTELLKQLNEKVKAGELSGTFKYTWPENNEGAEYSLYYKYLPKLNAFIATTAETEKLNESVDQLRYTSIFGLLIAVLLVAICIIIISRSLTGNIKRLMKFSEQLANGNLYAQTYISQDDEIGRLASALEAMRDKLKSITNEVNNIVANVVSGSGQIASSSQSIASGASEQAASTEELSASVEQMTATVEKNADNARETEQIASDTAQSIIKGKETFAETVTAMHDIVEKISVVQDIAERTDLLAVNAAIEAARAGQSGKGFAVVAVEVRKLSEQAQDAAQKIQEMSLNLVAKAESASELFDSAVPKVQNTANLIQEISSASVEQASGMNQINRAIEQLTKVVEQSSATAEELASSSAQLKAQAGDLRKTFGFFRMEGRNKQLERLRSKLLSQVEEMVSSMAEEPEDDYDAVNLSLNNNIRSEEEKEYFSPVLNKTGGIEIDLDSDDNNFEKF